MLLGLQIQAISAKLLDLKVALGNRADIDVSGMLIACPDLLRLELPDMMQRLMVMKVCPQTLHCLILRYIDSPRDSQSPHSSVVVCRE